MAVGLHEARLAREADERTHVVEKVHHRKREDDGEEPVAQRAAEIKREKSGRQVGYGEGEEISFGEFLNA